MNWYHSYFVFGWGVPGLNLGSQTSWTAEFKVALLSLWAQLLRLTHTISPMDQNIQFLKCVVLKVAIYKICIRYTVIANNVVPVIN